jgi:hypothetical protein
VSRGPARAPAATALGRGDLTASLVLVFPLLLAYEIGVLFSSTVNGVDVVTRVVFAACGHDRVRYLIVHASLAVAYLIWIRAIHRANALALDVVVPLLLEAALWALSLAAIVPIVVAHLPLAISELALGRRGEAVVMSLGAGVHEELVFRVGALAGGCALLRRSGLGPRLALAVAVIGSALLFAAAHHWGAHGEAYSDSVFAFRALCGAAFGLIFWYRSLAHAVYAHVLYDLYVLALR